MGFSNNGNRRPAQANTDSDADLDSNSLRDSDADRDSNSHRHTDADRHPDPDGVCTRHSFHNGSVNNECEKSWPGDFDHYRNMVACLRVSKLRTNV